MSKGVARKVVAKKGVPNIDISDTVGLRRLLVETIAGVRSGQIDHKEARSVCALSNSIIETARLDLSAAKIIAAGGQTGALRLT